MYYIEHDGKQHFFEDKFFHKRNTFEDARQKDLMKNYAINLDNNSKLIRINYTWTQSLKISNKQKIIDKMLIYIKECISTKGKIFAHGDLYKWIDILPSEETIKRYYYDDPNYKININDDTSDDSDDYDDYDDDDDSNNCY